jgi:hypothetical protein
MSAAADRLARWASGLAIVMVLATSWGATGLPRRIGGGPIGGVFGIFDPGTPPPPPSPSVAELQARGFVCEPSGSGQRCDGFSTEPISHTTTLTVYLCDTPSSCGVRGNKPFPAKVPGQRFGLRSFDFPGAARASGRGDLGRIRAGAARLGPLVLRRRIPELRHR